MGTLLQLQPRVCGSFHHAADEFPLCLLAPPASSSLPPPAALF